MLDIVDSKGALEPMQAAVLRGGSAHPSMQSMSSFRQLHPEQTSASASQGEAFPLLLIEDPATQTQCTQVNRLCPAALAVLSS